MYNKTLAGTTNNIESLDPSCLIFIIKKKKNAPVCRKYISSKLFNHP